MEDGMKTKLKGPTSRTWTWEILLQEEHVWLTIFRVAMGDKAFLAYSGIGESDLSHSELTHAAMATMRPLTSSWFLDLRKSEAADRRVRSAFLNAGDDSAVLF